ncbi:MAG: class II fumarate hydratase [Proteobacteria bacterium]|nr:MAG: class II fumarate hydratase [Pseudomonadota bacterium]
MVELRTEHDSMGEVEVPANALYGASTQRAVDNFTLSDLRLPGHFIAALALIKAACARINGELGLLDSDLARAIEKAAREVARGRHDKQFPVDLFQTGSGTSTNMNANEVIATLAARRLKRSVHPNDHVNLGQSSNDVIPSALHVAAVLRIYQALLPALQHLESTLRRRGETLQGVVKTGRTHLMDAVPITLGQEIGAWATQIANGRARVEGGLERLRRLALGGTAVGTGLNAHPQLGREVTALLREWTGFAFAEASDHFEAQATVDAVVEMSGQLKTVAVSLMKIANDLRWMNSGPGAGLGEITLPALQPGSSIMPAKVNPVIPEAVAMVTAQVIGNDATITIAGQSGNFQLNVMLPLVAYNLLQSIELLANASSALADRAVTGFTVNPTALTEPLAHNPILATALNPVIGYEKAAVIAKRAWREGRTVREVAGEMTDLDAATLDRLLDPARLALGLP